MTLPQGWDNERILITETWLSLPAKLSGTDHNIFSPLLMPLIISPNSIEKYLYSKVIYRGREKEDGVFNLHLCKKPLGFQASE